MAERLNLGIETKELKLGKSFDPDSGIAFHSIRYDFKPASVDTTKEAEVKIGTAHSVSISLPHVEGSGTAETLYKGNKRPLQKECVLIINNKSGEVTLEKLSYSMQLKKTRVEGSSRSTQANRPVTPSDQKLKDIKAKRVTPQAKRDNQASPVPKSSSPPSVDVISNSDTSDSDHESETVPNVSSASTKSNPPSSTEVPRPRAASLLREDLRLSDSSSDSE